MDSMRVKFEVVAVGSTTFHSSKTNQDYQRARLIGFVLDEFGGRVPCTADLGFNGKLNAAPKSGDVVVLTLAGLSTRGAMVELTFSDVQPLPKK